MTGPRQHPRRRLLGRRPPVVQHAPDPAANVAADLEAVQAPPASTWDEAQAAAAALLADVSRETSGAPYVAGGQVPAVVEPLELEDPPPLHKAQVARLEALTAVWERETRAAGGWAPGPEDTMLAAPGLSRPPVPPPPRRPSLEPPAPALVLPEPPPAVDAPPQDFPSPAASSRPPAANLPAQPPRRVSDWTSRHDPRSLNYPVRAQLTKPVPLQDLLLERGPILDQGTTPPLTLERASACGGMAGVAAANVLRLESRAVYGRRGDTQLLGLEDAHALYDLARQRDHAYGDHTAGTSVLGVMKAGQELGHWGTYLWGLGGTRDVAQALLQLRAPVVLGLPWPAGLEDPDAAGVVTPAGTAGMGHMLTAVGLRLTLAGRPGPWFVLQQSRGLAEGDAGLVYLHHAHLAQLLAGVGEAGVPLPTWGGPA